MKPQSDDIRISLYLAGELSQQEQQALRAEALSNPELATALAEMSAAWALLHGVMTAQEAAADKPTLSPERRAAILAAPAPELPPIAIGPWLIGIIAAVAATVVIGFCMLQSRRYSVSYLGGAAPAATGIYEVAKSETSTSVGEDSMFYARSMPEEEMAYDRAEASAVELNNRPLAVGSGDRASIHKQSVRKLREIDEVSATDDLVMTEVLESKSQLAADLTVNGYVKGEAQPEAERRAGGQPAPAGAKTKRPAPPRISESTPAPVVTPAPSLPQSALTIDITGSITTVTAGSLMVVPPTNEGVKDRSGALHFYRAEPGKNQVGNKNANREAESSAPATREIVIGGKAQRARRADQNGDAFAAAGPADPFAAAGDPFAAPAGGADPFAAGGGGGGGGGDPFAPAGGGDPFASPAAPADPFAAPQGSTTLGRNTGTSQDNGVALTADGGAVYADAGGLVTREIAVSPAVIDFLTQNGRGNHAGIQGGFGGEQFKTDAAPDEKPASEPIAVLSNLGVALPAEAEVKLLTKNGSGTLRVTGTAKNLEQVEELARAVDGPALGENEDRKKSGSRMPAVQRADHEPTAEFEALQQQRNTLQGEIKQSQQQLAVADKKLIGAEATGDEQHITRWIAEKAAAEAHLENATKEVSRLEADRQLTEKSKSELSADGDRGLVINFAELGTLEKGQGLHAIRGADASDGRELMRNEQVARESETIQEKLENIIIPKISFEDASLKAVVKYLKQRSKDLDPDQLGTNFVLNVNPNIAITAFERPTVDPNSGDIPITMDFDNIPLGEAIRYICKSAGLSYTVERNAVIIGTAADTKEDPEVKPAQPTSGNRAIDEKLENIIIPKISFEDGELGAVIKYLKQRSKDLDPDQLGTNFFFDAGPLPTQPAAAELRAGQLDAMQHIPITLDLDNISLKDVIRYICQAADLKFAVEDHAVSIKPVVPASSFQTRAFSLPANSDVFTASPLDRLADGAVALPPGSRITVGTDPTQFIVTTAPDQLDKVAQWLAKLPVPAPIVAPPVVVAPVAATTVVATPDADDAPLPPAPPEPAPPVNPFVLTANDALSTFALESESGSWNLARRYIRRGYLPPPAIIRMEEFVNYFDYNYPAEDERTFTVHPAMDSAPFGKDLALLKVGVRGKVLGRDGRKPAHLVFLVDASGSMGRPDRLPIVQEGIGLALGQLQPEDRVTLIAYGNSSHLLCEARPAADAKAIRDTLYNIEPGTATNMAEAIRTAYDLASRYYRAGQVNRIILCSDGVANVGPADADDLLATVARYRRQGISFTSIGVGAGAYNDRLMEQLANQGDGQYIYLDSADEARRAFVDNFSATLNYIARNVKIQVAFDPAIVRRYRLIGYENRNIADKDFRNDKVDAGEIGSGQSATALYEVELTQPVLTQNVGTVTIRYMEVDTDEVHEFATAIAPTSYRARPADQDPRFHLAACAAEFAEILRHSDYAQNSLAELEQRLIPVANALPLDQKVQEFLQLVRQSQNLPEYQ